MHIGVLQPESLMFYKFIMDGRNIYVIIAVLRLCSGILEQSSTVQQLRLLQMVPIPSLQFPLNFMLKQMKKRRKKPTISTPPKNHIQPFPSFFPSFVPPIQKLRLPFPALVFLSDDSLVQYIFQMGQNNTKEQWTAYNSRDYFKQQVEFYRWRADPLINTHICKVFFQLQQTVKDKETLKHFLQDRVSEAEHISIGELMNLANEDKSRAREELMNFENYVCTLQDMAERLNLTQVLYVLQVMFSGYETLLSKMGKCRADLSCCFVTQEGEARIWFSQDYKSNQLEESRGDPEAKSSIISSQMTLIRKILELGERLSSNHTEFLHFSRQFRSYMERDILQNWNFANARKLINSYVYTYRINLPSNLKEAIARISKFSINPSEKGSNLESQSYFSEPKEEMVSTGSGFMKQHGIANQMLRNDGQRQFCHSDYSNSKKSDCGADHSIKSHSKKFSSTDLKNLNERNSKGFESPKISRSQLLPHKLKQEMRFKAKDMSNMQYSAIQTQRVRRQREYAKVGDKQETKLYNFSTSVGFSPNTNSLIFGDNDNAFHQENHDNNNANSILKQNQNTKQKKKLEKKVATISKYISYYQNQAQALDRNIANQIVEEQANTKPNIVHFSSEDNASNIEDTARINNLSSSYSMKINVNKTSQPKITHKLSYDAKNTHGHKDNSHLCKDNSKGKTEFIRSNCTSQHSDYESSQDNTYPRNCLTAKTLNKLLQNNEVSLHQSNGSFMSLQQGQGSQYSGVLCKMGRSVNILNIPSNKQVSSLQKKSNATGLNRSINC